MRILYFLSFAIFLSPTVSTAQVIDLTSSYLPETGPPAPFILSDDMPVGENWHRPMDSTFYWDLPSEVEAVAIDLSSTAGVEPMTPYRPPVDSVTLEKGDWQEGEQYLAVQFRGPEEWGMFSERKILIDGTSPAPFQIETLSRAEFNNSGVVVKFSTTDALSGISHYQLEVGRTNVILSPAEASTGYFVEMLSGMPVTLTVTAYDFAGNTRQSQTTLTPILITPGSSSEGGLAALIENEPGSVMAAVMAALLLSMLGYLVYERQRYGVALRSLRKESEDVQTQILKVFDALRVEIYHQINAIDGRTRISKKEKEAVTGLTKALEVSEKLLKKEVREVKKLLG